MITGNYTQLEGQGSIPCGDIWIGPWATFPQHTDRTFMIILLPTDTGLHTKFQSIGTNAAALVGIPFLKVGLQMHINCMYTVS